MHAVPVNTRCSHLWLMVSAMVGQWHFANTQVAAVKWTLVVTLALFFTCAALLYELTPCLNSHITVLVPFSLPLFPKPSHPHFHISLSHTYCHPSPTVVLWPCAHSMVHDISGFLPPGEHPRTLKDPVHLFVLFSCWFFFFLFVVCSCTTC